MFIKEGTKLLVDHSRLGTFNGIALIDFDTDKEDFYPVVLDDNYVHGLSKTFYKGDIMPCRNILCKLLVKKENL